MEKFAKEKLKEKNIIWHEAYTAKTAFLKRQFNDVVGKGSYFRWEGMAKDGSEYYVIVGPANIKKPRAKFFAGVRKLPATYSAGGKYFDSMDGAMHYANETWGVPVHKDMKPYTSSSLFNIARKVDNWKIENEGDEKEARAADKKERDENREERRERKERQKARKERMKDSFHFIKD